MTTEAAFHTAKGTEIRVFIRTEKPNLADHTVMNPCWELRIAIGDRFPIDAVAVEHPEHGYCLRNATLGDAPVVAPVPASAETAVRAVVKHYQTEHDARAVAWMESERRYEEGRDRMRRVLGSACVDD